MHIRPWKFSVLNLKSDHSKYISGNAFEVSIMNLSVLFDNGKTILALTFFAVMGHMGTVDLFSLLSCIA